jgi:hypothetical protein
VEKGNQKAKCKKQSQIVKESRPRQRQIQALIEALKKKPRAILEKLLSTVY